MLEQEGEEKEEQGDNRDCERKDFLGEDGACLGQYESKLAKAHFTVPLPLLHMSQANHFIRLLLPRQVKCSIYKKSNKRSEGQRLISIWSVLVPQPKLSTVIMEMRAIVRRGWQDFNRRRK